MKGPRVADREIVDLLIEQVAKGEMVAALNLRDQVLARMPDSAPAPGPIIPIDPNAVQVNGTAVFDCGRAVEGTTTMPSDTRFAVERPGLDRVYADSAETALGWCSWAFSQREWDKAIANLKAGQAVKAGNATVYPPGRAREAAQQERPWITHTPGHECPVSDDTEVEVRFGSGETGGGPDRAGTWYWGAHISAEHAIVAYRVVA